MLKIFSIAALATLLVMCPSFAQTTTGAITGTVTDASGAAIPNVKVTATNTATNVATVSVSNGAGIYNFPFLAWGIHGAAEAQGFKKPVMGPFALEVNQIARMDLKLEVGAVTESVEVQDVAPVLQTESTQTGDVLNATQADGDPAQRPQFRQSRRCWCRRHLHKPTEMTTSGRFQNQGGRPYVNGNREQTNNFLLDGVDINDRSTTASATSPMWTRWRK